MFLNRTHSSNIKVKFQDLQLDDYVLENSVLKSKLQSKLDALAIVNREYDKCCMERDRYKLLVEQLMNKIVPANNNNSLYSSSNTISGGEMFAKTKDHNNMLKLEVETLRSKLEDAKEDILALKKQLQKLQSVTKNGGNKVETTMTQSHSDQDYELVVQELEKIRNNFKQMQMDYQAILDEKEELSSDRDYYKSKMQRLNQQISYIISNRIKTCIDENNPDSPKPIVDIDVLATENKYLQERITQLQVEKEIIKRTLTKYKTLLENRNKNGSLNFKGGYSDCMTQKQVREFLDLTSRTSLKKSSAIQLKSLCLGLFEALNDKSIALQHQRKTNQILANRITELEKTLDSWCNGQKFVPTFPSQILLDEFLSDGDSKERVDTNERAQNEENKDSSSDSSENQNQDESECKLKSTKIVLPQDLEELVKEAMAEIKQEH